MTETADKHTHIYVICMERCAYKIGMAEDPRARLRGLQTGCPFELELAGTAKVPWLFAPAVEAGLHKRYAPWRLKGEWFARPERRFRHGRFVEDVCEVAKIMARCHAANWRGPPVSMP